MPMGIGGFVGTEWRLVLSVLAFGCFVCACEDRTDPAASSVSTGSSTAAPSSASAAPTTPPFDAKAFCDKLCKRSVDCGLEKAEGLAKTGDVTDKEALEKAKAERATVEQTCAASCLKSPPRPDEAERTKKVETCLTEKECAKYRTCIEDVALGK